jgi:hypothetical protein
VGFLFQGSIKVEMGDAMLISLSQLHSLVASHTAAFVWLALCLRAQSGDEKRSGEIFC